jgi:MinD superfamily P-loop ATPase
LKTLTVISGKGGTGKTSIVASFAVLSKNAIFADCDVDAADLSLLLDGKVNVSQQFQASQKAFVDPTLCTQCGVCDEMCHFKAIKGGTVDYFLCEGCGVCARICPNEAIAMQKIDSGQLCVSQTEYGPLVHAQLEPGEANSGKLVTLVRQTAEEIASDTKSECIIVDGPPGIGCPVIASINGTTAALVVTEPSLSAISDMKRVLSVCKHFHVPVYVCINQCDLHKGNTKDIKLFCKAESFEVLGEIPHDRTVVSALTHHIPVTAYADSPAAKEIKALWKRFVRRAQK